MARPRKNKIEPTEEIKPVEEVIEETKEAIKSEAKEKKESKPKAKAKSEPKKKAIEENLVKVTFLKDHEAGIVKGQTKKISIRDSRRLKEMGII